MVGSDLESKSGLASRELLDIDYEKTSKNGTKVLLMAGGAAISLVCPAVGVPLAAGMGVSTAAEFGGMVASEIIK